MNIVILDGYTLNPGDLEWSKLKTFGNLSIHDRTPPELVLSRAAGAEIIFTNKTVLDGEILEQLPEVQYIGVLATGYNVVDIDTAKRQGITVTNIPAYGVDSVAQMVFAHILNITNNVAAHASDVRDGGWVRQEDFCYLLSPQIELAGKKLGIVGYGDIGKAVSRLAGAFNMQVLIHTRTTPANLSPHEEVSSLEHLFAESDIISLHCPLTEKTHKIVNEQSLNTMKKNCILVNCSRGPLIDEEALADGLKQGKLMAACLDVLDKEPPGGLSELQKNERCFITPHIAWATREARSRLLHIAAENLAAYLGGIPKNVITS